MGGVAEGKDPAADPDGVDTVEAADDGERLSGDEGGDTPTPSPSSPLLDSPLAAPTSSVLLSPTRTLEAASAVALLLEDVIGAGEAPTEPSEEESDLSPSVSTPSPGWAPSESA